MFKRIYRTFLFFILSVLVFAVSACGVGGSAGGSDRYSNAYIKLTNIKEQVENYEFSFTVENISDEDIIVFTRVFLKPGGVVNSDGKKISKGDNYTFYCTSGNGEFFENPKGMVAIYDSTGLAVGNLSFEFDI